jgi:chitin deacetylase
MRFRRLLFHTIFACSSLLAIAGVFAYPWHGLSYVERWREARTGRIIRSARTQEKLIALTFDDGPDPRYTGHVLDILRRRRIKATFFVCGEMLRQNPALGRRIVLDGHAIGNHTESHPHMEELREPAARQEIDLCGRDIESITGVRTSLFRPPRGLWNANSFEDVRRNGYSVILWSLAFDRQAIKDSRILRERVVRLAKPGDIILMHDGSSDPKGDLRRPTLRELDGVITGLERRGFHFTTVPNLLHISGVRAAATKGTAKLPARIL